MEFDVIKKGADKEGLTSRADGMRFSNRLNVYDPLLYDCINS